VRLSSSRSSGLSHLSPFSPLSVRRALRAALPALVVALPPLLWVIHAKRNASYTALGRDQGIFQYVAWAVGHGDVDYRDVRDVNGPLTHMVHMAFLALGGRDEHRFRALDILVTGVTFAITGACLPGILRKRVTVIERAAWGLAGWVVLLGQYLLYLFWDIAQRESFCDWFLFPSLGLQLVAQGEMRRDGSSRRPLVLLGVAGGLSAIACFGKPTFALFSLIQVATLVVDGEARASIRARLASFALGAVAGSAVPLAFLFRYADTAAFLRISFRDVPAMYRFIWPRTFGEILAVPGYAPTLGFACLSSAVVLGLILDASIPTRALAIALTPLAGIVTLVAQAKAFPYHFHPITAGMSLQWMLLVAWLGERCRNLPRSDLARLLPFAAAAALAARVTATLSGSPHLSSVFVTEKGMTPETRESPDFLVYFNTGDFFPVALRQTAAYLRAHTTENERVQYYGMDPYVLFLARRKSATPYIYAYDLDVDAALAGDMLDEGLHPNGPEQARIHAIRDAHEDDLLARLQKDPPPAFVFTDKSPLTTWKDSWVDLQSSAPRTAEWVKAHYVQTAVFDVDHVWLRRDRAEGLASVGPIPLDLSEAERRAEEGPP
jgi:hypothetical protein